MFGRAWSRSIEFREIAAAAFFQEDIFWHRPEIWFEAKDFETAELVFSLEEALRTFCRQWDVVVDDDDEDGDQDVEDFPAGRQDGAGVVHARRNLHRRLPQDRRQSRRRRRVTLSNPFHYSTISERSPSFWRPWTLIAKNAEHQIFQH